MDSAETIHEQVRAAIRADLDKFINRPIDPALMIDIHEFAKEQEAKLHRVTGNPDIKVKAKAGASPGDIILEVTFPPQPWVEMSFMVETDGSETSRTEDLA